MNTVKDTPLCLKKYNPNILKELVVENIDCNTGTFRYRIVFYDPEECVKKTATRTGTFTWAIEDSWDDCDDEGDICPEITTLSFGGIAVSNAILKDVYKQLEDKLSFLL